MVRRQIKTGAGRRGDRCNTCALACAYVSAIATLAPALRCAGAPRAAANGGAPRSPQDLVLPRRARSSNCALSEEPCGECTPIEVSLPALNLSPRQPAAIIIRVPSLRHASHARTHAQKKMSCRDGDAVGFVAL